MKTEPAPRRTSGEIAIILRDSAASELLDFSEIFGRVAPVEVDLGSGDGSFLAALAAQNPERNFFGVERQLRRVRAACRKAARLGLTNVRVLKAEIPSVVEHSLTENSIDTFYLYFPDPWPKRRHQRRRVFTHAFLISVVRALSVGGLLRVATDQLDYFEAMQQIAVESDGVKIVDPIASGNTQLPPTKFQQIFERGLAPIYRLELRKLSPVR